MPATSRVTSTCRVCRGRPATSSSSTRRQPIRAPTERWTPATPCCSQRARSCCSARAAEALGPTSPPADQQLPESAEDGDEKPADQCSEEAVDVQVARDRCGDPDECCVDDEQ